MNRRRFLSAVTGGLLAAPLAAGCASGGKGLTVKGPILPTLWFCPDSASTDFLSLFTAPAQWMNARRKVASFKFFGDQMYTGLTPDAVTMGPNTMEALVAVNAYRMLSAWCIEVSHEATAIRSATDPADARIAATLLAAKNITAAGTTLARLDCDSTRMRGMEAAFGRNMTEADTVTGFKVFHDGILADLPSMLIGDIEPYPHYNVATHTRWLSALEAAGVHLTHYTLDVDWNNDSPAPSLSDIATIGAAVHALDIPYGVILDPGVSYATDQQYHDATITYATAAAAANLQCHYIVVESWWERIGTGVRDLPANLPETDPYTLTKLVVEIADLFNVSDTGHHGISLL